MNALLASTHLLAGLIAGICWYYTSLATNALLILLALACAIACFFFDQARLKIYCLYLTLGILGCAAGILRTHYLQHSYNASRRVISEKNITFSATVQDFKKNNDSRYPYTLQATTQNNITFQLYAPLGTYCEPGDTITVYSAFVTSHQTDSFQQYLQKEGTLTSIFLKEGNFTIQPSAAWNFNRLPFKIRNYVTTALALKMAPATKNLFLMILFGYKNSKNTKSLATPFAQWGTIHQLARSGLHLIIFIALCGFLLNCIPLSFIIRQFLLTLIVIFYMLISWPSISIMRAFIMFFLHRLLVACRVPVHPLYIFIITFLTILFYNPLQLFFLDFQLSFTLTGAIILFYYTTRLQSKNFKKSLRKYLLFR